MVDTPNVKAPLWGAAQATPWLTMNQALRIFDAFAVRSIIEDRDLTAPPGACADGARYLIDTPATGLWATHEGELAIAVGVNAASGWYFADVALEGMLLYVRDEALNLRYLSGEWGEFADTISRIQDLLDVDITGLADGYTLKWDQSNGLFYVAPDLGPATGLQVEEVNQTSYTFVLGDAGKHKRFTASGAVTVTVPPNSSVAFPVGTRIRGTAAGAGGTTLAPGAAVTLNSRGAVLASAGQYAVWEIEKVGTNEWDVLGDLA